MLSTDPQSDGLDAGGSTLLLNFHPDPASSRANAALAAAARRLPRVRVREMATLGAGGIDPRAEAERLLAAAAIVWLFPVQWYAPPALFKDWADAVLTRMYFAAYDTEGRRLEGRPLLVAATVGTGQEDYRAAGRALYSLEVLLRPLEATAHRCGLSWSRPFLLYRAGRLTAAELTEAGEAFAARVRALGSARAPITPHARPRALHPSPA